MADDIVIGEDIGLQFLIHVVDHDGNFIDLSDFSDFTIYFRKPDHSKFSVPATLYTNGDDGLISYISQTGDLDQIGQYGISASYALAHSVVHTSHDTFMVDDGV